MGVTDDRLLRQNRVDERFQLLSFLGEAATVLSTALAGLLEMRRENLTKRRELILREGQPDQSISELAQVLGRAPRGERFVDLVEETFDPNR